MRVLFYPSLEGEVVAKAQILDNNENIETEKMYEKVRALLMSNSRLISFIRIPSYAIRKYSEI